MVEVETKIKTGAVFLCFPTPPQDCDYIRIRDQDGEELEWWHYSEWATNPQYTMGKVFNHVLNGLLCADLSTEKQ